MTTLQDLLSLLNGQYIEEAGTAAQNQCVDLANSYIESVLNYPKIIWTNAVDFPSKAEGRYDWIPNTPTGVPQRGDLVIWGGNQYGHIAIFLEGDANKFLSFDQNYPVGSPCHVQEHNYNGVKGWMRPKNKPVETEDWKSMYLEMKIKYDEKVALETFLRGEIGKKDIEIATLKKPVAELLQKVKDLEATELRLKKEKDDLRIEKDKSISDLSKRLASIKALCP